MPYPDALPQSQPPYVVSSDVHQLMGRWAAYHGLALPPREFFTELSDNLGETLNSSLGVPVDVVPEEELLGGMTNLMQHSRHPVVSLDRAYVTDQHPAVVGYIDATRAVHYVPSPAGRPRFQSAGALLPRPHFPPLAHQLDALRTRRTKPIALVDDVIFNGDGVVSLAHNLAKVKRPVAKVIAGIGITAGVKKIQAAGMEVECVRTYDDVHDEVCERDFFAGVPMSGRTVVGTDGTYCSAPYFWPYGNPEEWASIPPEKCLELSRFCLQQSLQLWTEVERANRRHIPDYAVPRILPGTRGHTSVTTLLREDLAKL